MAELTLRKGGTLSRKRWDSEAEPPGYVEKDVTDVAFRYIFDQCTLEEGVTLRDIFLLLQRHIEIFHGMFGNWCDELVAEGLSGTVVPTKEPQEGEGSIDFLEVYWSMEEDSGDNSFNGYHFPSFHGWGDWSVSEWNKDEPVKKGGWGVEFSPTYELIDYEVKLRTDLSIHDDHDYKKPPREYKNATYTLGHILYAIVWELSFCGGPKERNAEREDLEATVNTFKNLTPEELEALPEWKRIDGDDLPISP